MTIPEAALTVTDAGLAPASDGWFALNAREAAWLRRPARGLRLGLTGVADDERAAWSSKLGLNLLALGPGEPIGLYHAEADQEGFLVVAGRAHLLIEEQERPLAQWDFVHCPPHCRHMIIGARPTGCVVL